MDRVIFAVVPWALAFATLGPNVAWGLAAVGLVIMICECLGLNL